MEDVMNSTLKGAVRKFLRETACWALLRRFWPAIGARRMLTPWNDLIYLLRPFQDDLAFPAGRSINFGHVGISTKNDEAIKNRGKSVRFPSSDCWYK